MGTQKRREDILGDIAEVLDLGLQAPVPLVFLEKLVLVEETACAVLADVPSLRITPNRRTDIPRVESAHGVVTFHATVHDSGVTLLSDTLLCDLGVDPVRETPHVRANLAELDGSGSVVLDGVLEGVVEVAIVQEDVGVVIPAVEVALDGLDGLDDTVQLLVSGEDDEGAIDAGLAGVGLEAAGDEDLVVFFADSPVEQKVVSALLVEDQRR